MSGEERSGAGALLRAAAWMYPLLALAGLVWIRLRTGSWVPEPLVAGDLAASLLMGAGLGGVVILASQLLGPRLPSYRWLTEEFRRMLGRVSWPVAAWLALLSSIGEEIFFRGALQPAVGYALASLIFGLVHVGPDRRYLVWTGFAMGMGFALGAIQLVTGNMAGALVAHFLVNFVNLALMDRSRGTMPTYLSG